MYRMAIRGGDIVIDPRRSQRKRTPLFELRQKTI